VQVRLWDVATGTNHQTLNHNKAVHAVGMAPGGDGVVAFGGAEGALHIWDPRARKGDSLVRSKLNLETNKSCFQLASLCAEVPSEGSKSDVLVAFGDAEGALRLWHPRARKGDSLVHPAAGSSLAHRKRGCKVFDSWPSKAPRGGCGCVHPCSCNGLSLVHRVRLLSGLTGGGGGGGCLLWGRPKTKN